MEALSNGAMHAAVSVTILVNPAAGSGRAIAAGAALQKQLPDARVVTTERAGDATRLARRARHEGASVVVPVGGDGTISECVTGLILEESGQPALQSPALGLLPSGTGGDFRRTWGIGDSVVEAATRILEPNPSPTDVALVQVGQGEMLRTTTCVNVLSFGIGGLTDRLVARGPKWLGGRATYLLGATRATLTHRAVPIELVLDGREVETAPFSNVAVCNASYFGGGMHICPPADPTDGWLDVVTIELSKARTLALSAHVYRGTHLRVEGVNHLRCRKLEARTTRAEPSLVDVDGEQMGQLPLSVQVLKGALQVLT